MSACPARMAFRLPGSYVRLDRICRLFSSPCIRAAEYVGRAAKLGAKAYIAKSVSVKDLVSALKPVLNGEMLLQKLSAEKGEATGTAGFEVHSRRIQ
jgi:hypothetical protein